MLPNHLTSGITHIDNEHERLLSLLNELRQGPENNDPHGLVLSLVDGMLQHFSIEERDMHAFEYPHYLQHKYCHEQIQKAIDDLIQAITDDRTSPKQSASAFHWITALVEEHLGIQDQIFVRWLKSSMHQQAIAAS